MLLSTNECRIGAYLQDFMSLIDTHHFLTPGVRIFFSYVCKFRGGWVFQSEFALCANWNNRTQKWTTPYWNKLLEKKRYIWFTELHFISYLSVSCSWDQPVFTSLRQLLCKKCSYLILIHPVGPFEGLILTCDIRNLQGGSDFTAYLWGDLNCTLCKIVFLLMSFSSSFFPSFFFLLFFLFCLYISLMSLIQMESLWNAGKQKGKKTT